MKRWLHDLNLELDKYLYEDEKQEAISFYEEIVNDRLDRGERLDDVLKDYNPKIIAREITTTAIIKRNLSNRKVASKSAWQMLLILFSSPILIPLGIVYLAVVIVFCAVLFTAAVTMISLLIYLAVYIPTVMVQSDPLAVRIGMVGVGLIAVSIASLVMVMLYQVFWFLVKVMLRIFTKPLARKRV